MHGVQTDGSSVHLPKIAELNNAKVDMIPDKDVNWYVDYNFDNISGKTGLPVGTLRIPSFLVHNDRARSGIEGNTQRCRRKIQDRSHGASERKPLCV